MMSEPVKTFSVGLAGAASDNELSDARYVSSVFGTEHHELELELNDGGVDLEQLVWHLDEPLADLSSLGFLSFCELARRHVTVALSGQGADELLGGYRKHRMARLVGDWQRIPRVLRAPGELAARRLGPRLPGSPGRIARALAAPGPAERLLGTSAQMDPGLRDQLARARCGGRARAPRCARSPAASTACAPPLPAALHLDGQLGLVDDMLTYFDRASMAHSLEVRVPFLDHHVVEFAATIPADLKVGRSLHRLTTKQALRDASRGLVPDRIIDKPKIGFFNSAVDRWFAAQTRGAVSDFLLGPSPRYAELLDRQGVEALVARPAPDARPADGPPAPLGADARGLAADVPAACDRPGVAGARVRVRQQLTPTASRTTAGRRTSAGPLRVAGSVRQERRRCEAELMNAVSCRRHRRRVAPSWSLRTGGWRFHAGDGARRRRPSRTAVGP